MPRWGRRPALGLEGTAADDRERVAESGWHVWAKQAGCCLESPLLLEPRTFSEAPGMLLSTYFCVKATWLDLVSLFPNRPNRPVSPDCLCHYQLIYPSVQSLSRHIVVQCLQWARTLTTEAALVSTFANMGVRGQDTW